MIINNINDIVKGKGLESPEQLEHYVYKYTDCGAWINWDDVSVTIGSIVEGSDAEFSERFCFPVESDDLDDWVMQLESLCEDAWNEANGICECEDWVCEMVRDCGLYMIPEDITLEDAAYNLKQYEANGEDIPLMMTEVLFMNLWNEAARAWRQHNVSDDGEVF